MNAHRCCLRISACMLLALLLPGTLIAAESAPPRMANGRPDLSGHWANPYTPDMAAKGSVLDPQTLKPLQMPRTELKDAKSAASGPGARTLDLPYTDWGLKRWKSYDPVHDGDYAGSCLPFGLSRNMNSPHGLQIVQGADAVAFLFEQNTWFHWVPTSGQKWPTDLPPSWNGQSIGHWEGDTLVIETSGFNGYTRLDTAGHPHSRQLKLTNRFTRLDASTLQHSVTVHDPRAYTRDWTNLRTWRIKPPADMIMEYSCEESSLENLFNGTIKPWKPPENDDED
ncbi:MAG: hypothetical protein ABI616_13295 [Pseudomonadota bacterium]